MTLRQLPGALILGLLASLFAHTLGFRDGHAQAGSYHDALISLAAFGGVGLLVIVVSAAFSATGPIAQGTVLAARISSHLPSPAATLVAAVGWFIAGESLEPEHAAVSIAVLAVALIVAVIAISLATTVVIRAVAEIAFAILSNPYALREPVFARRAYVAQTIQRAHALRRPVNRPPPGAMSR